MIKESGYDIRGLEVKNYLLFLINFREIRVLSAIGMCCIYTSGVYKGGNELILPIL